MPFEDAHLPHGKYFTTCDSKHYCSTQYNLQDSVKYWWAFNQFLFAVGQWAFLAFVSVYTQM